MSDDHYNIKILLIFPSTVRGGVEEYTLKIVSAATQLKWDVHVAFPQAEGTVSLVHDFTNKNVQYHPLNIAEVNDRKLFKPLNHLFRLIKTVILIFKVKPNLVQLILPNTKSCFASIIACGLFQIPTLVRFGLVPCRVDFSSLKLRAYAWVKSRNQQWIAVSQNNRKIISESFKVPFEEVLCVYNGTTVVANTAIRDNEEDHLLRRQVLLELNLPESSRLALTVGRLSHQKGYHILIPAIPYIVDEFPEVTFVWVGEGELRDLLTSKVREYNIEKKVLFLGFRSDVPRLLKAADLFVFPTLYEGHSNALNEAMAHSLQIVTSDASSIPEIVQHKVHGLVFRKGDSCDLLEMLRWALGHPDQMQQMATNAQKRALDFPDETMIEKTFGVLQSLYQAS